MNRATFESAAKALNADFSFSYIEIADCARSMFYSDLFDERTREAARACAQAWLDWQGDWSTIKSKL